MTAKKRVAPRSTAREHIVPVRFGADELRTLHERAEAAGLEPSTYLRALALRPESDPAAVAAVAHRAARAAGRVREQAETLLAAVDELDAARRAIESAIPE